MLEKEKKIKNYNRVVSIISEVLIFAGLVITFSAIFGAYSLVDSGLAGMTIFGVGIGFLVGFAQAEQRIIRLYSLPTPCQALNKKIIVTHAERRTHSKLLFAINVEREF